MRTYTIQPYFQTLKNGKVEQQGYIVKCNEGRWEVSYCAVELCETAVLKREQLRSSDLRKQQIFGKNYQIDYQGCKSEASISETRLKLYEMEQQNATT